MLARAAKRIAQDCGFELAGVAAVGPIADFPRYRAWVDQGMAGAMGYLTDHRAALREDVRSLLPSARSVICVGKLYHTRPEVKDPPLSRYAWGQDYHDVLKEGLEDLARRLQLESGEPFEWKACVDTAPVLERSLARQAGLGWIGKNTCLIHEPLGSWFFLGELITSLPLEPDSPPPDRCGTCSRCIDACPTQAIVPSEGGWTLDARRCIPYLNIELRGSIPEALRDGMGEHVFGCDICQDVCPWNSRAPVTGDSRFAPLPLPPPEELAHMDAPQFRAMFRHSPVIRAKYAGFLRNLAVAMGNSGNERYRGALESLADHAEPMVREHAQWALEKLSCKPESPA